MAEPIAVEPRDAAPVQTPVEPQGAPEDTQGGAALPPELVQLPAMQALLAGSPPAVSVPVEGFEKRPEGKLITANKDALMGAGIAFYRSLGGDLGAIFNRAYIEDQELINADKAGKLAEIAPPMEGVAQELASSGTNHPVLNAKAPTSLKSKSPTKLSKAEVIAPQPAAASPQAQSKAMTAKVKNLAVGSPTSGPKPGSGRILNNILKPVL